MKKGDAPRRTIFLEQPTLGKRVETGPLKEVQKGCKPKGGLVKTLEPPFKPPFEPNLRRAPGGTKINPKTFGFFSPTPSNQKGLV